MRAKVPQRPTYFLIGFPDFEMGPNYSTHLVYICKIRVKVLNNIKVIKVLINT